MFKITVEGSTLDELKANLAAAVAAFGGKAPAAGSAPKGGAAKETAPKEEPAADEDDGSEGIEYQTISDLVVRISKEKGRDDTINFLKTFKGANGKPPAKAAEILPKDYPRALKEATELLEASDFG